MLAFYLTAVSWPGEVLALGGDEVTVYGNSQHCLRTIFVNLKLSLVFRKGKQASLKGIPPAKPRTHECQHEGHQEWIIIC